MAVGIKVNPEYEALCPPLSTEEYAGLKESIREEGLWKAIEINEGGEILDGHHRYKACNEVGKPWDDPRPIIKKFNSKLHEKVYVLDVNIRRRQLNKMQRISMALERKKILDEIGILNKRLTFPRKGQRGFQPMSAQNFVNIKDAKTKLSKEAGVSRRTLEKAQAILEKGSEKLKKRVLEGKTSISHAYTKIKRQQKHDSPPPLPEGVFDVILADPPWRYYLPLRGNPDGHYSTMDFEKICDMEIPTANDTILFLWATNPHLGEALEVIRSWGFDYVTNMAWVKDRWGTGYYLRGQHELLLIAKRGKMPPPVEEVRPSSVLQAPVREHSRKPDEVYDIIETLYPNRSYLELFARNDREGWTSWGVEVE